MNTVFVIGNQQGLLLNKHKEWIDGSDAKLLFRSPHKDEALNLVFELSSKDIFLRAQTIEVELDDKKQPVINADCLPTIDTDNNVAEQGDFLATEDNPTETNTITAP